MELTGRTHRARFGAFDVDLRSGQLHKHRIRLKLQDQPFQVLALLLEHPGELVTREEFRQKLWPADTFVDFDTGLNSAIKKLRDVLGDSADEPRYIQTLPRRGYRFLATVQRVLQAEPVQLTDPSSVSRRGLTWNPVRLAALGLAALAASVMLAGALGFDFRQVFRRSLAEPNGTRIRSIVVLPLENLSRDPDQEYFADGMTDALITDLAKVSSLRVISRTSAMRYRATKKSLSEIAREVGVDAVVEGTVMRAGDRVRISAQLIEATTDHHLWAGSYERDLRDVLSLQDQVTRAIVSEVRAKLTPQEHARLATARPANPRAYEAYLRGRYLQTKRTAEDMRKALAYFQHALAIDPSYAPAYVGIMECYAIGRASYLGLSLKEGVSKTKEAAQRVVELDDTTAAAHYALAMVKLDEWDFPGAEKEFEQALELNPGDAQVRQHYGQYLSGMGRHADSIREMQHALALDPLSPLLTADLGWTYYYARQYDPAVKQGRKALEMEADFDYVRSLLAWSYWRQGLVQEALGFGWPFRASRGMTGGTRAKEVHEQAGVRAMLRWMVNVAKQRRAGGEPATGSMIAGLYVELGDKEQAFAWLEKAYEEHVVWLPWDTADPQFDPLRSDPRFQSLRRRLNLPP
jgi:TolB-like protein/DNA-binding winged helix-turn-helix (wHTH) protein/Tfp pilus assembly protein PilF